MSDEIDVDVVVIVDIIAGGGDGDEVTIVEVTPYAVAVNCIGVLNQQKNQK